MSFAFLIFFLFRSFRSSLSTSTSDYNGGEPSVEPKLLSGCGHSDEDCEGQQDSAGYFID